MAEMMRDARGATAAYGEVMSALTDNSGETRRPVVGWGHTGESVCIGRGTRQRRRVLATQTT